MQRTLRTASLACFALAALNLLPGCKAKKTYPDPDAGWHNADFSIVFGKLLRISAHNLDDPPVWVVRYGLPTAPYGGQLALTPPGRLVGYSGGELVEIRGHLRSDLGHPDYSGTWYEITGIRLWENYR